MNRTIKTKYGVFEFKNKNVLFDVPAMKLIKKEDWVVFQYNINKDIEQQKKNALLALDSALLCYTFLPESTGEYEDGGQCIACLGEGVLGLDDKWFNPFTDKNQTYNVELDRYFDTRIADYLDFIEDDHDIDDNDKVFLAMWCEANGKIPCPICKLKFVTVREYIDLYLEEGANEEIGI